MHKSFSHHQKWNLPSLSGKIFFSWVSAWFSLVESNDAIVANKLWAVFSCLTSEKKGLVFDKD